VIDLYSTVIAKLGTTRDFVVRSNVQRTLVNVVLLSYELSTLIVPNEPHLVEYLLWCLSGLRIGEFPDTQMEDLVDLNRNIYELRRLVSDPSSRSCQVEEYLLESIGSQVEHANSMLLAAGFNLEAPEGHCKDKFKDDENSVTHCNYAMGILERSFELMKSETISDSGLSRPIWVGIWYVILILRSKYFAGNPSCINRPLMTMDAFLIKAQREVEGSESISTATVSVLEASLSGILELFEKV